MCWFYKNVLLVSERKMSSVVCLQIFFLYENLKKRHRFDFFLQIQKFGQFSVVLDNFYFVYDNFCKTTPISRFLPGKYFLLV
jgi:hypothetical protein